MSFSDNAMGLSFQGVTVPSCEQIEMIQPYVTHILRVASGAGGQTAWRAEARGVMKMILSHERFEDAHLFMSLLHTAKAEMVDNVCANLLMSAYKKRNCLSQVLLVFSQLRALWQPDLVSFNIAVDACGKAKQVIGAHSGPRCADIVHALPADVSSFVPHVLPQVQLAFTFLEEMRAAGLSPTVNTYTSLIDACGKTGDLDNAELFLGMMMGEGVRPNACTFTTLIQACCRSQYLERAFGFLRMLVECESIQADSDGLQTRNRTNGGINAIVDKTPYTTFIKSCLDLRAVETAFDGLGLMLNHRVGPQMLRPDFTLLREVMDVCLITHRLDLMLDGFKAHRIWGFSPHHGHVLRFLRACMPLGLLNYIHEVIMMAKERNWPIMKGIEPKDDGVLCSLFDQAVRIGYVKLAFLVLAICGRDRRNAGFDLSDESIVDLVATCAREGKIGSAFEVLYHLKHIKKPPTKAVYENLLVECCGNGCCELIEQMAQHRTIPSDEYALSIVVELCAERHAFEAAEALLVHLEELHVRPTVGAAQVLLRECVVADESLAFARLYSKLSPMFPGIVFSVEGVSTMRHCSFEDSPVSITTSPTQAWGSEGAMDMFAIDGVGFTPQTLCGTIEAGRQADSGFVTPPTNETPIATASDELAELAAALARLAQEEMSGCESPGLSWWSEA